MVRLATLRSLWPYAVLSLVLILAMAPVWSSTAATLGGDIAAQHYFWQVYLRQALSAGELPFWNPYVFSGVPAFANPNAGYGYPLHWLLVWLPPATAVNLAACLHVLLAGCGAAWCARRMGASREGCLLSGVIFTLGGSMTARLWAGHLAFVEALAWLPWATGLAVGPVAPFGIIRLALSVALMALAGQPELVIFSAWWLPLCALGGVVGRGSRSVMAPVLRTVGGLLLGLGLAAFQLLPAQQLLTVSYRESASWEVLTASSLPPWHLLTLLSPTVFGDPATPTYWPGSSYEWHEQLICLGIVGILAAAALPGRWRWLCWGGAGAAIALSFGHYVPWYAWAQAVLPGYRLFRIPSRQLVIAALGLALAAGLGLDRLRGASAARALGLLAVATAGAGLFYGSWFPVVAQVFGDSNRMLGQLDGPPWIASPGEHGLILAAGMLTLCALITLLPGRIATRSLVLVAIVELGVLFGPYRTHLESRTERLARVPPLLAYQRIAMLGDEGVPVAQDASTLGRTSVSGYSSLFSNAYAHLVEGRDELVSVQVEPTDLDILGLLGVQAVFDRDGGLLQEIPAPKPAAWVAHCVWPGGPEEVRLADFPRDSCITRWDETEREPIVPAERASTSMEEAGRLQAQAEGPGWLVTRLPWYPGWRASLDGSSVPVEVVDGALVGVQLPPGTHDIQLRYVPAGLEAGLAISVMAMAALTAIAWLEHRGVWAGGLEPAGGGPARFAAERTSEPAPPSPASYAEILRTLGRVLDGERARHVRVREGQTELTLRWLEADGGWQERRYRKGTDMRGLLDQAWTYRGTAGGAESVESWAARLRTIGQEVDRRGLALSELAESRGFRIRGAEDGTGVEYWYSADEVRTLGGQRRAARQGAGQSPPTAV